MSEESAGDESDTDMVTIDVNAEVCIGVGSCELLQPDQFRIDDDTAIVALIGDGRLARSDADLVVDRCPSGALSIVEDGPDS